VAIMHGYIVTLRRYIASLHVTHARAHTHTYRIYIAGGALTDSHIFDNIWKSAFKSPAVRSQIRIYLMIFGNLHLHFRAVRSQIRIYLMVGRNLHLHFRVVRSQIRIYLMIFGNLHLHFRAVRSQIRIYLTVVGNLHLNRRRCAHKFAYI
jgi:hypothetical protein